MTCKQLSLKEIKAIGKITYKQKIKGKGFSALCLLLFIILIAIQ